MTTNRADFQIMGGIKDLMNLINSRCTCSIILGPPHYLVVNFDLGPIVFIKISFSVEFLILFNSIHRTQIDRKYRFF